MLYKIGDICLETPQIGKFQNLLVQLVLARAQPALAREWSRPSPCSTPKLQIWDLYKIGDIWLEMPKIEKFGNLEF